MPRSRIIFGILELFTDFFAAVSALLLARYLRTISDFVPFVQYPIGDIPTVNDYLPFVMGASLLLVGIFAMTGLYPLRIRQRLVDIGSRIGFSTVVWMMFVFSYFFLTRDFFFSRIVLVYGWILAVGFIFIGRKILGMIESAFMKRGYGKVKVLVLGNPESVRRFHDAQEQAAQYDFITGLGEMETKELEKFCSREEVEEIILASALQTWSMPDMASFCATHHIGFRYVPYAWQIDHMNMRFTEDIGVPMIELIPTRLDGWGRVMKRIFDTIISAVALLILWPLFILIAVLVKLDSQGPVFFSQKRMGYHRRTFTCHKFRSMVKNAEELKSELEQQNERGGPLFKIKSDPRITKFGKFLRKTSLDELPQLWNVLMGNMSIVGPRPHLPHEVERYEEYQRVLLSVKPGITGMAQVSGRSGLNFDDEVKLDLYYIRNWSFFLDISIIFRTIFAVLEAENAD